MKNIKKDPVLLANLIRTPDGTVLQSFNRHDYKTYTDKSRLIFSVDGGTDYLKRGIGFDPTYIFFSLKEIELIKKKNLVYSPVSGRFSDENGYRDTALDSYGYRTVKIHKKTYKAHRLVFLLSGVNMSNKEVDHRDNVRNNNVWTNLRVVSKEQNQANSLIRKDSTTGIKGLSFHKKKKLWIGRVQHENKRYEVSSVIKEKAIEKLNVLREKLHKDFSNNGIKNTSFEDFYTEMSVYSTDSFEKIRKFLYRGGRGKDGKSPLTYVPLFKISDSWLKNLIQYEEDNRPNNKYLPYYKKEAKYRKRKGIVIPE